MRFGKISLTVSVHEPIIAAWCGGNRNGGRVLTMEGAATLFMGSTETKALLIRPKVQQAQHPVSPSNQPDASGETHKQDMKATAPTTPQQKVSKDIVPLELPFIHMWPNGSL